MQRHSHAVLLALTLADAEARAAGSPAIEPAHLFLALCKSVSLSADIIPVSLRPHWPEIERELAELRALFAQVGFDAVAFRRKLRALLGRGAGSPAQEKLHRSPAARAAFSQAEKLALAHSRPMRTRDLLIALLQPVGFPWPAGFPVQPAQLAAALNGQPIAFAGPAIAPPPQPAAEVPEKQAAAPAGDSILARFGRDLTQLARDGKIEPVIGRKAEMRQLAQILMQKRKSNAILIGDAGVGKTGIVEGLAQRIVGPKPPEGLQGKRIVEITMSALVAGAKLRGEFEERLQGVLKQASGDPNLILFIDEIHTMMDAGGKGSANAANILKPALARGDLRCIGATTTAEYRQHIEKDPAIERRFQVVWVEEPTRDEALEILAGLKPKLEQHHGLIIGNDAVCAAVDLSIRYVTDFRLPDKGIDLLDQACARARMPTLSIGPASGKRAASIVISRNEIAEVVAQRCRIPLEQLTADESARLLEMESHLGRRVIGQDDAIRAVAETIRTARAGLKNPKRPIGVFLFAGSSGTGKTELAKALAEFLYGDERRLIRFDMSEYMEQHAVARLIGAPPGYIGHDEEGQLTGAVRTHPASVVLFDEIEKAHPRVLDLFLQIFDDARLTDSRGRHAKFNEAVIILTSNLGCGPQGATPEPRRPIGFAAGAADDERATVIEGAEAKLLEKQVLAAVQQSLRPELVNRLDGIVVFHPLSIAGVRRIIDKILDGVGHRLKERRLSLQLTNEAYALLMEHGYKPEFGAREMERAVERFIVQPLGKALLEGRFNDGDSVEVCVESGAITLN